MKLFEIIRIPKWLLFVFSTLIGITFIYSSYSKLFPIELFEIKLVETRVSTWILAPFQARIIIGIELFIGMVMISNIHVSRLFYSSVIGLLSLFSIHLIFQIISNGNQGNCGCFSNEIPMTPLEAILKNAIIILLVLILYRNHEGIHFKWNRIIQLTLLVISLATIFIINPILVVGQAPVTEINQKLPLDSLYSKNEKPQYELRKGKWILAYLSLTCPHCRMAAYKLQVIKNKNGNIPIYFFIQGNDRYKEDFFKIANLNNIYYTKLKAKEFIQMSGTELPAIYFVENSIIKQKVNYIELNQTKVEEWLAK